MTIDTGRRWWGGVLCGALALALGCSDRTSSGEGDGGSESAGESGSTASDGASGGFDGTTEPAACEWAPVPLGIGIEPAPECAFLVSSGEAAPVMVRVVNVGDAVVWLTGMGSCSSVYVGIEDAAGQQFWGKPCTIPCEASLLGECGCLLDCPLARTIALAPGGVFETEWPGYVLEAQMQVATAECVGESCEGECSLRTPPAAGSMRVAAAKATRLEDCGECECTPNESGWCEVPGYPADQAFVEHIEQVIEWPLECPLIEIEVR